MGLSDFNFHDLRHCAINALLLVGNDYFKIMAISGHKTMACYKRYNLVTEQELKEVKWPGVREEDPPLDAYLDTKQKWPTRKPRKPLKSW